MHFSSVLSAETLFYYVIFNRCMCTLVTVLIWMAIFLKKVTVIYSPFCRSRCWLRACGLVALSAGDFCLRHMYPRSTPGLAWLGYGKAGAAPKCSLALGGSDWLEGSRFSARWMGRTCIAKLARGAIVVELHGVIFGASFNELASKQKW